VLAIVVSRADEASEHVGERLLDLAEWETRTDDTRADADGGGTYSVLRAGTERGVETEGSAGESERVELRTFEDLHLHLERVATAFGGDGESAGDRPELLVFASRHSGETGPLLTAHFTGNVGAAEYGGRTGELAEAAPAALSRVVGALDRRAPEGYGVGVECTHHGPSRVGCPSLFVEVGSGTTQWRDADAARAVAAAILTLRAGETHGDRTVVGQGGGHYAPRFARVLRETAWDVGHVAADWSLADLDRESETGRETLRRVFERSGADRALIDGDRPDLAAVVADLGYEVVGESWLRAVDDRPLGVVETVEERLGRVADGVALGERETTSVAVRRLPSELASEAEGIDPEAAWSVVAGETVAFETAAGGSRLGDRVALPVGDAGGATADAGEACDELVAGLAGVLREKFETVERRDGMVVATRTAFDPELARAAGVPEGPAFGRLADGRPVEVDGETIVPGTVHRERRREFET
jgi:D-aminoacyl-tRNA deacylase